MQITIITGNLGQDPELRYLPSGTAVCNFSVAVTEYWNDRETGQKQEKTTWYRVSAWGVAGENANKYLEKGSKVGVRGTVSASAYINKEGEAQASLELRAQEIEYLSPRSQNNQNSQSNNATTANSNNSNNIPF